MHATSGSDEIFAIQRENCTLSILTAFEATFLVNLGLAMQPPQRTVRLRSDLVSPDPEGFYLSDWLEDRKILLDVWNLPKAAAFSQAQHDYDHDMRSYHTQLQLWRERSNQQAFLAMRRAEAAFRAAHPPSNSAKAAAATLRSAAPTWWCGQHF